MFEDRLEKSREILKKIEPKALNSAGEPEEGFYCHSKKIEEVPAEFYECLFWSNLHKGYYWRSMQELKVLFGKGKADSFLEADLKAVKDEMVKQAMAGETVASSVPLFNDVWAIIGAKDSPLEKLVTEQDKKTALNKGFWYMLDASSNPQKTRDACRRLDDLFAYEDFFRYYDFANGSFEAQKLQLKPNFENFGSFNMYIRWLLVQEGDIGKRFEDQESNRIVGKLTAPLLPHMLSGREDYEDWLAKIGRLFVRSEIIASPDMQEAIGEVFEEQLLRGFQHEYSFSNETFRLAARNLVDKEKYIQNAFQKAKTSNYATFEPLATLEEVREYVPREVHNSAVSELEAKLKAMKKLDSFLFSKWISLKPEKEVSKAKYSSIRNAVFDIYFSQGQRPASSELLPLSRMFVKAQSGTDYIFDKLNGFLFSDLVLRQQWIPANELLIRYNSQTPKPKHVFLESIANYVKEHHPILLNPKGISPRICYPNYNCIADLYKTSPNFFKLTK